jgi:hypothetical protein
MGVEPIQVTENASCTVFDVCTYDGFEGQKRGQVSEELRAAICAPWGAFRLLQFPVAARAVALLVPFVPPPRKTDSPDNRQDDNCDDCDGEDLRAAGTAASFVLQQGNDVHQANYGTHAGQPEKRNAKYAVAMERKDWYDNTPVEGVDMAQVPIWVWLIGLVYFGPKLYYALQVGRRKKARIRFRVRRAVVALSSYLGGFFVLTKLGYPPLQSLVFAFVLGVATGLFFVPRPDRSRIIPKKIRQAVIARDLKGAKFDATIHHLDHIVPFSKGGDHSVENLRVLPKKDNLSRGAKMPTMKDFRKRKLT